MCASRYSSRLESRRTEIAVMPIAVMANEIQIPDLLAKISDTHPRRKRPQIMQLLHSVTSERASER